MVVQEKSQERISRKSFDTQGFQDLQQVWNTESSESINNQLVTPNLA